MNLVCIIENNFEIVYNVLQIETLCLIEKVRSNVVLWKFHSNSFHGFFYLCQFNFYLFWMKLRNLIKIY